MKILGLLNSPWMIDQGTLTEITREYLNHMKGGKLDFKALILERDRGAQDFEVINDIAVIPLKGVMTPGMSFFSFFFDGTSTKNIQKNIQAVIDKGIKKAIIDVNSGGGAVEGSFELADFIAWASTQIEIIAFSDGTIASAAYLAVSGVSKIFITGKSNQIGSIGVIARKVDFTKMHEMEGLQIEEFVTGKFKNTMSSDKSTTDEDRKEIQSMVSKVFTPMVMDISERRNLDPQEIVDMNGATFIGAEAIENGLVDGVSTLEELLNESPGVANFNAKQVTMDKAELKLKYPELFAELDKEAFERGEGIGVKSGATTGAEAERTRIDGITQACFPGQEELCAAMIADGKTQPGEAAIRFNSAEKQTRVDAGTQTSAAMPAAVVSSEPVVVVPVVVVPDTEAKTPEQEFEASAELKAEFTDIDEYKAFLSANEGGQVNIFKGGSK